MKLVTVSEMQQVEREANSAGLSYEQMMENAGRGLAEKVASAYSHIKDRGVLGLVGSGNNGGDTLVALSHLAGQGWKASAYIVRPRQPGDPLVSRLEEAGGEIENSSNDPGYERLKKMLQEYGVVLDGVLGTGIKLPLKPEVADTLDTVRRALAGQPDSHVIAVDCPSGVDCDSGDAAAESIPAEMTVTMAAVKTGLLNFPAYNLVGRLELVGIGLSGAEGQPGLDPPSWQAIHRRVADRELVRSLLPARPLDAHKGTFGTAMVVAGSVNFTGAGLLAGKAAYRSGAGLVTLAVPAPLHNVLAGQFVEATWVLMPASLGVIAADAVDVLGKALERVTALLAGPGFGLEDTTKDFLDRLLSGGSKAGHGMGFMRQKAEPAGAGRAHLPPLVVDADGLKLLARLPDWAVRLPAPAVLTPHPGEMSILTGLPTAEIQGDRLGIAERFAREWGHVVVLKGAFTVVAAPDSQEVVIPVASPALARAGTGDVLAGLIVGLRAQGMEAFPAAVAGAWIHARAGLRAAQRLGSTASVLAGDVLESVIEVMAELV